MLKTYVQKELTTKLLEVTGKKNPLSLPRLVKVVINCRVPDARENQEALNQVQEEIMAICGQKATTTKAKKAISNFKTRIGDPLAVKVTLRQGRMYDFVEKLFNLVLPRLRDFKGMSPTSFDGSGNYNFTIHDHTYFPEINLDKITKVRPVQVTLVISASSQNEAKMLLSALGFPFQKEQENK